MSSRPDADLIDTLSIDPEQGFNWYPGHMRKGADAIRQRLEHGVDLVLDVRDARLPWSSGNPVLSKMLDTGRSRRIIVFNKADLADPAWEARLRDYYADQPIAFVNALSPHSIGGLANLLAAHARHSRFRTVPTSLLLTGFPNTGKSSLINGLRARAVAAQNRAGGARHRQSNRAARVGGIPGITRDMTGFFVPMGDPSQTAPLYCLDTPGVMIPGRLDRAYDTGVTALRLGAVGSIPDERMDVATLAEYVLRSLNRLEQFRYVSAFRLEEPTDDIVHVLDSIAGANHHAPGQDPKDQEGARTSQQKPITTKKKKKKKTKQPGEAKWRHQDVLYERAARLFLRRFRGGALGRVTLDTF